MIVDEYDQVVLNQDDIIDLIMRGRSTNSFTRCLVEDSDDAITIGAQTYENNHGSVKEFDKYCQSQWFMPEKYHSLDIISYILDRCKTNQEIERAGQELIVYQEKNLLNLLRYLVYLVDVMKENKIIWGVGRGSSVSSYVLFVIGIHRINSIDYDLDYRDFLR